VAEILVAPDAKAIVITTLAAVIGSPVVPSVPDPRPARFVRVILTGGPGRRSVVFQDEQVTIDCWDTSTSASAMLAMLVDGAMYSLPALDPRVVHVAAMASPTDLPDPDSGQPRHTCTYQVTVRCAEQTL
jgi:hypothetical protein